jgi:hypothetical protein
MFERSKLRKALRKLALDGNSLAVRCDRTIECYKLVIDLVEKEQWIRSFSPRKKPRGGLSNLSSENLAAHKGWAGRVIVTAESLKKNEPWSVNDARGNILHQGILDLDKNRSLFLTKPRDNFVLVAFSYVYGKVENYLWRRAEKKRKAAELALERQMLENLKSLAAFPEACDDEADLDQGSSSLLVMPEKQAIEAGSEVKEKKEDNGTPNAQVQ